MPRARSPEAKDERRAVLLQAALDEFFERGFTAARMDDIARRAGVSKGALYLYFDSKEQMFSALIDTVALPNLALIEQKLAQAASAREALFGLLAMLPKVLQRSSLPRLAKILIGDANHFPDMVRAYRERMIERGLKALTGLVERGNTNGEWQVANPALTARLIMAPALFAGIWQVVFQRPDEKPLDVDALFAQHAELLARALGVERPETQKPAREKR
ncbi:TetR/AcrR family transcriptional regulator [Permianibacter aggregans]|uniref:TetR family transcriptional regulator n=1 Tax=Permianibacter aggregans TaxID=1510150 RepID=A0A4R6ULU7_9GAMM|nr:TetR/AcrR family transcriptional regulator [Permianibacter aggregans]QGX39726.1 TetR/AcrR family transcriptional regulator [Permianibacter aggregans]TDQ47156.1 TetR family transcriptional regulator [Permianibacter aggregans]